MEEKHKNFFFLFFITGDCDWKAGGLSGCVYNVDPEVTTLITEVYGMSAWTNPLHPEVFPGIRKMEAEIVQMGIHMFHGGPDACGTVKFYTGNPTFRNSKLSFANYR